jgi:hypothetical protein
MKTIKIKSCKGCPHFSAFPAECFEGDCSHPEAYSKTRDTRITNEDAIPDWCPL